MSHSLTWLLPRSSLRSCWTIWQATFIKNKSVQEVYTHTCLVNQAASEGPERLHFNLKFCCNFISILLIVFPANQRHKRAEPFTSLGQAHIILLTFPHMKAFINRKDLQKRDLCLQLIASKQERLLFNVFPSDADFINKARVSSIKVIGVNTRDKEYIGQQLLRVTCLLLLVRRHCLVEAIHLWIYPLLFSHMMLSLGSLV